MPRDSQRWQRQGICQSGQLGSKSSWEDEGVLTSREDEKMKTSLQCNGKDVIRFILLGKRLV